MVGLVAIWTMQEKRSVNLKVNYKVIKIIHLNHTEEKRPECK